LDINSAGLDKVNAKSVLTCPPGAKFDGQRSEFPAALNAKLTLSHDKLITESPSGESVS